jgi:hypothetical protein
MDSLREVVYMLDRYKVRQIDVLTNNGDPKESRYFECYVGLREGRWKDNDEIAAHFGIEPGSKTFTRFKNELKKRLSNSLLFIDTSLPEFNDYNRAYISLLNQWAVAKLLFHRGAKSAFMELAEQALSIARKFEYVDLIFDILRTIKIATLPLPQYHKEYQRYKDLYYQYKIAFEADLAAREAYESAIDMLVGKRGYKKDFSAQTRALQLTLKPFAEQNDFVVFNYYYRLLDIYADLMEHKWADALEKTTAAKTFLESKPFMAQAYWLSFAHQEVACLIMLNQFERTQETLAKMREMATEGFPNWFKTFELGAIAAFYAGDYTEVWKICKTVTKHPRFSEISSMDQESWRVFQGYLVLLVKGGAIPLSPREKGEVEKFRLQSWLNDLPLFSQDKRGANIPVLILQALLQLQENRLYAFESRVEALRKYRQRNLDANDEHFRTDCFIRLLELLPRFAGKAAPIRQEGEKWLEKMRAVSNDLLDRSYEVEVVPYERQWEWVLNMLEKQPLAVAPGEAQTR